MKKKTNNNHQLGIFESIKFADRRATYQEYKNFLENSSISKTEIIENGGAFIGDLALNRIFTLVNFFKLTENIAGHIADVGTYKGGSALLFSKLLKIYNSESIWQVHGFDWFKGMKPSNKDFNKINKGGYTSSKSELLKLANLQNLNSVFRLHDINLTIDIKKFMSKYPHLNFRLVFMDAGIYEVMDKSIPEFWKRLTPGGIMVFDQLSHELSPGEIAAVRKHLPNEKILTIPNSWMPNAYIIKS